MKMKRDPTDCGALCAPFLFVKPSSHFFPSPPHSFSPLGARLIKHSGPARLRAAMGDGLTSAKSFAVYGGVYAAATCVAARLRDKEDGEERQ